MVNPNAAAALVPKLLASYVRDQVRGKGAYRLITPNNPVTSPLTIDLNAGASVVVNITGSTSVYGPGYVARTVTNGVAHTYGEGEAPIQGDMGSAGPNPAMMLGNYVGNDLVWGNQMNQIIANAKQKCGCKP